MFGEPITSRERLTQQRNTEDRLRLADLLQKQLGPLNRGTLAVSLSADDALAVCAILEQLER